MDRIERSISSALSVSVIIARVGRGSNKGLHMAPVLRRHGPVEMQRRTVRAGLEAWAQAPHMGVWCATRVSPVNDARRAGGRRWMSVEGAESEEDQHEIMFYSLRHAATVTLKEMHHFGAQVQTLRVSCAWRAHHPMLDRLPSTALTRMLCCRQTTGARCCSRRNSCTRSCPSGWRGVCATSKLCPSASVKQAPLRRCASSMRRASFRSAGA